MNFYSNTTSTKTTNKSVAFVVELIDEVNQPWKIYTKQASMRSESFDQLPTAREKNMWNILLLCVLECCSFQKNGNNGQ